MKTCTHPGCKEPAVRGRLKLCVDHRSEREVANAEASNQKTTEKRKLLRAANPPLCREPGCSKPVVGKSWRCPACKDALYAQRSHGNNAPQTEVEPLKPKQPEPPKERPILITDAEQAQIDRAIHDKLNRACGYGNGPVKRYTPAEIAALNVTPIDQIRHHDFSLRDFNSSGAWQ